MDDSERQRAEEGEGEGGSGGNARRAGQAVWRHSTLAIPSSSPPGVARHAAQL